MTGTADLIKRLRFYHERITHGEPAFADPEHFAQAADALEAAERVIAPFAGNQYDTHERRAAAEWMRRHATQRQGGDDTP